MRSDGSKVLNPGLLRHRITWQEKTVTGQDSLGQNIYEWDDVLITPARVVALVGRELELAQQRWAEARFRVEMHYITGIKREMRGLWGTRYLNVIDAEDPWGTGMVLHVVAKEWVE
jgi:SPP1 family predicted phage head-tail adaptor